MNCQQFNLILEELELEQLPAEERSVAEAHLESCAECARIHELHRRLAALPVPPASGAMLGAWRAHAISRKHHTVRHRARFMVVGALAALAAAAAMFTGYEREPAAPVSEAAPPAPSRITSAAPVAAAPVAVPPEPVVQAISEEPGVAASRTVVAQPAQPAQPAFTIWITPLVQGTDNLHARNVAEEYYATLLEQLRANSAIRVVTGPDAMREASKPADLRLGVSSSFGKVPERFGDHETWDVRLGVEVPQPGSVGDYRFATSHSGDPACVLQDPASIPADSPCTGSGLAKRHLRWLYESRIYSMPDSALEAGLLARLRDPDTSASARAYSLQSLIAMRRKAQQTLEPELARAVLQQARLATEPLARANLLDELTNQRDSSLAAPLIEMLRRESDVTTRRKLVTLLAQNHVNLPEVRSVLVSIASDEPVPLIRRIAERAVSGSAPWQEYVIATTVDTSLSIEQRFEPLDWTADTRARWGGDTRIREDIAAITRALLDRGHVQALADVLVEISRGQLRYSGHNVQMFMLQVDHPGVVDLLLALCGDAPDPLLVPVLQQFRDDPRIAAKLEEIAAPANQAPHQ